MDDTPERLQNILDGPIPMNVSRQDLRDAITEINRLRAEVHESARRNITLFGELQTAVEEINRLRSAVVLCPRCVETNRQAIVDGDTT